MLMTPERNSRKDRNMILIMCNSTAITAKLLLSINRETKTEKKIQAHCGMRLIFDDIIAVTYRLHEYISLLTTEVTAWKWLWNDEPNIQDNNFLSKKIDLHFACFILRLIDTFCITKCRPV